MMKRKIAFALLMGLLTTGIISCVLLLVNTNDSGSQFLAEWLRSWGIAYGVVIPCILFLSPWVEKVVHKLLSA